jgi:hypothetical protein
MDVSLSNPDLEPGTRFVIMRTRAMLLLGLRSLKRGSELGLIHTDTVLHLPDRSGLLFNCWWGKTIRDGSVHVFGVRRSADPATCPVHAVTTYVTGALAMGIVLRGPGRFLFPPWVGAGVHDVAPLAAAQLNTDLRFWLDRCQINGGETVHGLRSGGAVQMLLKGASLQEVMRQAHWRDVGQATHYLKAWEVACLSVVGQTIPAGLTTTDYAALNEMAGFSQAF